MRSTWLFIGSTFFIMAAAAAAPGCGGDSSSGASSSGAGGNVTGSSTGMGGQTSTSTSSSSGGSGKPCAAPSDCGTDNVCAQWTCDNKVCGQKILLSNMPAPSQVYGDCKTAMCDDKGNLSVVNDDKDVYDDGNACTADACSNGMPLNTPAKLGTMCGDMANPKVCDMASACVQCVADMDCMANVSSPKCSQGKCVPAGCVNMMKDGLETGTDCGGTQCAPCADGGGCKAGTDCVSSVCMGPVNNKTCQKATCGDGVKNGNETDVDCGGADCVPMAGVCDVGQHCVKGSDCLSSVCKAGLCQAASCSDGVQNQMEKGPDCGGPCPTMCP